MKYLKPKLKKHKEKLPPITTNFAPPTSERQKIRGINEENKNDFSKTDSVSSVNIKPKL
jgi:hypothetical protein